VLLALTFGTVSGTAAMLANRAFDLLKVWRDVRWCHVRTW
jgi:hypothetical protein